MSNHDEDLDVDEILMNMPEEEKPLWMRKDIFPKEAQDRVWKNIETEMEKTFARERRVTVLKRIGLAAAVLFLVAGVWFGFVERGGTGEWIRLGFMQKSCRSFQVLVLCFENAAAEMVVENQAVEVFLERGTVAFHSTGGDLVIHTKEHVYRKTGTTARVSITDSIEEIQVLDGSVYVDDLAEVRAGEMWSVQSGRVEALTPGNRAVLEAIGENLEELLSIQYREEMAPVKKVTMKNGTVYIGYPFRLKNGKNFIKLLNGRTFEIDINDVATYEIYR